MRLATDARYQVAVLDPANGPLSETLRETLRRRLQEVGLDPDEHLRFLNAENYSVEMRPQQPLVGVYFGGVPPTAEITAALDDLLDRFAFVLPVVDSTDDYTSKVPARLHPLNGLALSADDPKLEEASGRLLEELRLVRRRRVAFVSYRRAESRGVASQVFHALEDRRFRVLLDTVSVQHGRPFQEALWNRMLDTDVLVFLHTKGALDSQWSSKSLRVHRSWAWEF